MLIVSCLPTLCSSSTRFESDKVKSTTAAFQSTSCSDAIGLFFSRPSANRTLYSSINFYDESSSGILGCIVCIWFWSPNIAFGHSIQIWGRRQWRPVVIIFFFVKTGKPTGFSSSHLRALLRCCYLLISPFPVLLCKHQSILMFTCTVCYYSYMIFVRFPSSLWWWYIFYPPLYIVLVCNDGRVRNNVISWCHYRYVQNDIYFIVYIHYICRLKKILFLGFLL